MSWSMVVNMLTTYLLQLPLCLVWMMIGIVAFIRRHRHPKVSLFTSIGVALLLVDVLVGGFMGAWLPHLFFSRGWGDWYGIVSVGLPVTLSVIAAAAYVTLVAAVFTGRDGDETARPS